MKERLEATHEDGLYFPFAISDKRPLRAAQGYLTKFPAGLVEVMPELRAAFEDVDLRRRSAEPAKGDRRPSGAGWMRDTAARRAIESHAVEWAMAHLAALGYEVENVGDWFSYDVRARRGSEDLHVEVKGTTGEASTVELTANEVAEDDGTERVLVVVDLMECKRVDGRLEVSGGRPRMWREWAPADEHLTITRYRYTLPAGWVEPG